MWTREDKFLLDKVCQKNHKINEEINLKVLMQWSWDSSLELTDFILRKIQMALAMNTKFLTEHCQTEIWQVYTDGIWHLY